LAFTPARRSTLTAGRPVVALQAIQLGAFLHIG